MESVYHKRQMVLYYTLARTYYESQAGIDPQEQKTKESKLNQDLGMVYLAGSAS